MENQNQHTDEPSTLDIRCSTACTRAGLTTLIFAVLAISMLQPMKKLKTFQAVGDYVTLRLSLKDNLEGLNSDPCWRQLVSSEEGNKASTSWNLSELNRYMCDPSKQKSGENKLKRNAQQKSLDNRTRLPKVMEREKTPAPNNQPSTSPPAPPAMPSGMRLLYRIDEVHEIIETLKQLSDDDFLQLARSHSYRFDRSIWKWQIFRNSLFFETPIEIRTDENLQDKGETSSSDWQAITQKMILENLTIEDAKALSEYEPLELSEIERILKELDRINLPSIGFPMGIVSGSVFVELGMCFTMLYFWLFFTEAKRSPSFPPPGTLFGVFGRTRTTRNLFLVLTVAPVASAALLAYRSFHFTGLNIVTASAILFLGIKIAWEARKLTSPAGVNEG